VEETSKSQNVKKSKSQKLKTAALRASGDPPNGQGGGKLV
jgi:hypothetical protein